MPWDTIEKLAMEIALERLKVFTRLVAEENNMKHFWGEETLTVICDNVLDDFVGAFQKLTEGYEERLKEEENVPKR
jgi:hypothetical protein